MVLYTYYVIITKISWEERRGWLIEFFWFGKDDQKIRLIIGLYVASRYTRICKLLGVLLKNKITLKYTINYQYQKIWSRSDNYKNLLRFVFRLTNVQKIILLLNLFVFNCMNNCSLGQSLISTKCISFSL